MKFFILVLSLVVFILSSSIHLYASFNNNVSLRAKTKGFILSSLFVFYICAAEPVRVVVAAAIFLSWAGDVLLIPKSTKCFIAGGLSFLLSHCCYAYAYYQKTDFSKIPVWVIICSAVIFVIASIIIFNGLKDHIYRKLFVPFFVYFIANGTMNCFSLFQMICIKTLPSVIIFMGAILFFISDAILFYVRFNKKSKIKSHFPVMLTYISAEFLIVLGLVLL